MDNVCADPFNDTREQRIPLDGFEPARPIARGDAGPRSCDHVGPTENDADAVAGPASTIKPDHDVVDDADLPGSVLPGLAQRLAIVLDSFQYHWNRHTVFHYRLGAPIPAVPKARRGTQ